MSYTLYKKVKVNRIKTEQVTRRLRPQEIADPARRRSDYSVSTAELSDVPYDVSISDFKEYIQPTQVVSVAVDENWQVIAVVNHTTGQQASLKNTSINASEILSTLFYMAIPGVLCFFIARKAFQTIKYHDAGWWILGAGALLMLLILRGVGRQFSQSKAALNKLLQA